MMIDERHVVVFDGVCNLCRRSVTFILLHERDHLIRFAAAQSAAGRALLREFDLDPENVATFVFLHGDVAHVRSDAALEVARHLRLPWRMVRILRIVPRRLRDAVYDFVARHRYRWFGRRESCLVPTPDVRSRFLDQ
jgi:predicted DCC family thiol-disulfide oxidoreductase YuxK